MPTVSRRAFCQAAWAASLFCPFAGGNQKRLAGQSPTDPTEARRNEVQRMSGKWRMPDEGERHSCTWMAFGPSQKVWGRTLLEEARENLATIAEAIARFETVVVCVRERERDLAKSYFAKTGNIEWFECPLADLWIRDFGAVFVVDDDGRKSCVDFNFNGWGEKQDYDHDAEVAGLIAEHRDVDLIETELCLEGGGIEVDGQGTAIITESCVLNDNRNPDWTKSDCAKELRRLLGLEKIIWLLGVRGVDITDGHTDFYARFASPGVVVAHLESNPRSPDSKLTRRHLEILEKATDAAGRKLEVVTIEGPTSIRDEFASDDFCAGYINFYVCNGAVIVPKFGDRRADANARKKLAALFPKREIVMLNIDGIAAGGGGIHCATQQEPIG
jgi:agmatine deiminase